MTYLLSLPLWERGFKRPDDPRPMGSRRSLPLWERGFKHDHLPGGDHQHDCRSPCGSVDLNISDLDRMFQTKGRSPCGSVDLNAFKGINPPIESVAPLVGAWI